MVPYLPSWGPHSGRKAIGSHNTGLWRVALMGKEKSAYITPTFSGLVGTKQHGYITPAFSGS